MVFSQDSMFATTIHISSIIASKMISTQIPMEEPAQTPPCECMLQAAGKVII
jgi:hypothetical protein